MYRIKGTLEKQVFPFDSPVADYRRIELFVDADGLCYFPIVSAEDCLDRARRRFVKRMEEELVRFVKKMKDDTDANLIRERFALRWEELLATSKRLGLVGDTDPYAVQPTGLMKSQSEYRKSETTHRRSSAAQKSTIDITLGCNHKFTWEGTSAFPPEIMCSQPDCGYVLDEDEMDKLRADQDRDKIRQIAIGDETMRCMFHPKESNGLTRVHRGHYVCEECLRKYSNYAARAVAGEGKDRWMIKCPARKCQYRGVGPEFRGRFFHGDICKISYEFVADESM